MKINEIVSTNYEIEKLYQDGELSIEEVQDNKEMLLEVIQNKAEQIIFKANEVNSDIEKCLAMAKFYTDKANSLKKQQENVNSYIAYSLEQLGLEEIKTPIGKIKVKESVTPDKEQLEKGLDKNGIQLPNECFDYIVPEPFYKRKDIKVIEKLGIELKKNTTKKLEIK